MSVNLPLPDPASTALLGCRLCLSKSQGLPPHLPRAECSSPSYSLVHLQHAKSWVPSERFPCAWPEPRHRHSARLISWRIYPTSSGAVGVGVVVVVVEARGELHAHVGALWPCYASPPGSRTIRTENAETSAPTRGRAPLAAANLTARLSCADASACSLVLASVCQTDRRAQLIWV